MTTALVTTTINVPAGLRRWASQLGGDDVIVVAGDHRTPHAETREVLADWSREFGVQTLYLYDGPEQERWQTAQAVGWDTVQRRNVATLEALRFRPDVIYTVDDDNFPTGSDHVRHVADILDVNTTTELTTVSSATGWFNVGSLLTPSVVHRGFPLDHRHDLPQLQPVDRAVNEPPVGVFASLWTGDPDIDAIERIHCDPRTSVEFPLTVRLAADTWCPFNSQATAYAGEFGALLCVPSGLGRYDDIWGSYVARRVLDRLGYTVAYGAPYVEQVRNRHNLMRDLDAELYGMRATDSFVTWLRQLEVTATSVVGCLTEIFDAIERQTSFFTRTTIAFTRAWCADLLTLEGSYVD